MKAAPPPGSPGSNYIVRGGPGTRDPGEVVYNAVPLRTIVARAYNVKYFQVSGPSWIDTEKYSINAKVPADTSQADFLIMMQSLLTDRFAMKIHTEARDIPVYTLVRGKNALKMRESPPTESGAPVSAGTLKMQPNGSFNIVARNRSIESLISILSQRLDRPVLDYTDLPERYDFELQFENDESSGAGPVDYSALAVALRNQTGLDLQARRVPFPVIVIDQLQKIPIEN